MFFFLVNYNNPATIRFIQQNTKNIPLYSYNMSIYIMKNILWLRIRSHYTFPFNSIHTCTDAGERKRWCEEVSHFTAYVRWSLICKFVSHETMWPTEERYVTSWACIWFERTSVLNCRVAGKCSRLFSQFGFINICYELNWSFLKSSKKFWPRLYSKTAN